MLSLSLLLFLFLLLLWLPDVVSVGAKRTGAEGEKDAVEALDGLEAAVAGERPAAEVAQADGVLNAFFQRRRPIQLQLHHIVDAILRTERAWSTTGQTIFVLNYLSRALKSRHWEQRLKLSISYEPFVTSKAFQR